MKATKLTIVFLIALFTACSSVRVSSDFDTKVDFSKYKTFAYHKTGIDKAEISDLDKKRILRAIETELTNRGLTISETPDLLVNIFTKERERIDINQFSTNWGYGWGWGWNPFLWGGQTYVTSTTEGTLYIDLIDAQKKELVWQGVGTGYLSEDRENKEARITEFVTKILSQFPPN